MFSSSLQKNGIGGDGQYSGIALAQAQFKLLPAGHYGRLHQQKVEISSLVETPDS